MSIGLTAFVAVCQTTHYRTGREVYLRMTRFWGKFTLISMAIGVVTGIVQEFQFGMNWSVYSKYVGDVFGAPLAMEGLIAFFLESTFLALWLFGWGRLSPRLHLACAWAVSIGCADLGLLHPRRKLLDAAPRRLCGQSRHASRS
jgi:cytochrome d ubiquinol oxidase subunit I